MAYLDIAKAFDTVSHEKLFQKLGNYGIVGNLLGWLKSWLTNRVQRVRVNETFSEYAMVKSGVPQGSVLGPLLFLIYINDLPSAITSSSIQLFADDCKLFLSVHDITSKEDLQSDLENVHRWCETNQLTLATSKCTVLHLGRRTNPQYTYVLDSQPLPSLTCARDLGVLISDDLNFTEHCNTIANGATWKANMIYNCFKSRRLEFLLFMYKVYVRSRLEYATTVWSPSLVRDINKIESVQRQFTRKLAGLGSLDYTARLIALN